MSQHQLFQAVGSYGQRSTRSGLHVSTLDAKLGEDDGGHVIAALGGVGVEGADAVAGTKEHAAPGGTARGGLAEADVRTNLLLAVVDKLPGGGGETAQAALGTHPEVSGGIFTDCQYHVRSQTLVSAIAAKGSFTIGSKGEEFVETAAEGG